MITVSLAGSALFGSVLETLNREITDVRGCFEEL
jgi:hypothetical protein